MAATYSGTRCSVVPNQRIGRPTRRNSGRRSFSLCPPPRSRVTAADLSLYSAPIGLSVTLKIEPCTNCGWYPSVSFSASSFQLARVRCLSQPAVSSTRPSGDSAASPPEPPGGRPRVLGQRGPSRGEAAEHEARVGVPPRPPPERQPPLQRAL